MTRIDLKAGMVVNAKTITETIATETVMGTDFVVIATGDVFKHVSYNMFLAPIAGGVGNAVPSTTPAGGINTYNVRLSGTYTNFLDSGGVAIIVTADDLEAGWVQLRKEGSSWSKAIMTFADQYARIAKTFDPTNQTEAVSASSVQGFLTETPNTVNFNFSDQFTVALTSISNPDTRYTKSIDGNGYLKIDQIVTQVMLIGMLTPDKKPENKVYETVVSFDTIGAGTGFGLCVNPSSGNALDSTNHISLVWRANGTLTAYLQDGTTVNSTITFSPATNTVDIPAYTTSDVLRMTLQYSTSNASATLTLFKNGIKCNEFVVYGLVAGFMGTMLRNTGSNTARIQSFTSIYLQEKTRNFYINGSAPPGGNGTETNPFQDLNSAILRSTETKGDIKLYLKSGIYRGGLQFAGYKYRNIELIGRPGDDSIIRSSILYNSGWTKTAGQVNIYERTHNFAGLLNSNNSGGGIIDLSNTTALLPFRTYNRLSPNGSLSTLDGMPGACMVNTTSRKMYVHAYGSVDPNTLNLECSNYQHGIGIMRGATDADYFCNVKLRNLTFQYAYSHNIAIQRGYVDFENVIGIGSVVSNGFGLDDSIGKLYGCQAIGNYNDGYNAIGGNGLGEKHAMWFYDCIGNKQLVGDGMSNHDGTWYLDGGEYNDNGKDGVIPTGDAVLKNVTANRNVNGFQLYPSASNTSDSVASLWGCSFDGNTQAGIHVEPGSSPGLKATINAYSCRVSNNTRGLMAFNSTGNPARSVINSFNTLDGGGNTTKISNSGGTINMRTDIPLV